MKRAARMCACGLLAATVSTAGTNDSAVLPLGPRGEIGHWLVLGYIPLPVPPETPPADTAGRCFDWDPFAAGTGEAGLTATGGVSVTIGEADYRWRRTASPKPGVILFVTEDGTRTEKTVAYLYTELICDASTPARLLFGSDDAVRVYVDGRKRFEWSGQRSVSPDEDELALPLAQGVNRLLVRVDNYVGAGGLAARVVLGDGNVPPGVRVRLPGAEDAAELPAMKSIPWSAFIAKLPEIAPAADENLFGARLTRTMSLLATSHLTGRPVRILFYGQSIVGQQWPDHVVDRLRERFPEAVIEYEKPAIGGYQVPNLERTARHDVWRARPDLIVFHAYGGNRGQRERLIYALRRETTADILLFTHHVDARDEPSLSPDKENSAANIRRLAQKYNCELAEVREEWKDFLRANPALSIRDLLVDGVHLNEAGCVLMAQLVERHFRNNTLFPSDWSRRVRGYDTLRCIEDRDPGALVFSGAWKRLERGVASASSNDAIRLRFVGNRVDLVLPPCRGSARVLIDGKAPSQLNLFHATRPQSSAKRMGKFATLMRVGEGPDLVPETWTLTFRELDVSGENPRVTGFRYDVAGSVTGPDGEGSQEGAFVSNSGRIRIDPADFCLVPNHTGAYLKPGLQITWDIVPDSRDRVSGDPGATPLTYVTVADGLPCREHDIEITPEGGAPFAIAAVEVYCPELGVGR